MKMMKAGVFMMVMLFAFAAKAQMVKDPTTWTVEAKRTAANTYDVIFHAKIQPNWHLFSMNPGGDGMIMPPIFKLNNVKLNGRVKEKGKLIKERVESIGNEPLNYYTGSVDFIQSVTGAAGTKVSGTYKYQVCNDQMCLAPTTKKFEVTLK